MRIAVAGTSGLAQLIAHYVREETSHQLVMLSRKAQPSLDARGYQVQVANYDDLNSLEHALAGIDIIISTVSGPSQLALIKAAVNAGVRRFAPAEFEGPPSLRQNNDPLDRGRASAMAYIDHYRSYFEATTVFVCGILYERFQPGGLAAARIGASTGVSQEGNYILDLRYMTAQVPAIKVYDLVAIARSVRGREFFAEPAVESSQTLRYQAALASTQAEQLRLHNLAATADGQHDFSDTNLNSYFPHIRMTRFRDWLTAAWAGVP
ncbi:putative isoflavone reductase family protein [Neofusicoccum parvum UCRNP2]|uniref:Putative isoflavone reductase family protein n=1 Tax=Botryosphaeria parva (strain UCR-NP2) TaxID=1287680 RepID=R1G2E1_BOTPV|nr:putative isoflavone reductase family protein [Neofusicoccum parvum UCRNP2]